nr:hypothetical protein L204_03910 [Cryptococcus depauperatus CBS 7855]
MHISIILNFYRFPQHEQIHLYLFRASSTELDRLADFFGSDPVFQSTGGKPQTPAKLQLAVSMNRMAHGEPEESIAHWFDLPKGDVARFYDRCLVATVHRSSEFIAWPSCAERDRIKYSVQNLWGLFSCVDFIDGMLLLVAVDHMRRFTDIQYGYSARSSDMRAQQASRLHTNPDGFFSPGEYILGNAIISCTRTVIAMFRTARGQADLNENRMTAKARVMVEQAFGVLKARFSILRLASIRMRTEQDDMRIILTMNAACILHNLLLKSWRAVIDAEVLWNIMHEERETRAEHLRHRD